MALGKEPIVDGERTLGYVTSTPPPPPFPSRCPSPPPEFHPQCGGTTTRRYTTQPYLRRTSGR